MSSNRILDDTKNQFHPIKSFDRWQDCPFSLSNHDFPPRDTQALNTSLIQLPPNMFCGDSETSRIDVFEVSSSDFGSKQPNHFEYNATDLENHLAGRKCPPKFTVMWVSPRLPEKHPLSITEKTMHKIFAYYQVNPKFLANLSDFGDHPQAFDAGSGNYVTCFSPNGSYEMMYTLKYAEKNGRPQGNPYSIRQTAIYYQHTTDGAHMWITLHPKNNSAFYTRLKNVLLANGGVSHLKENPFVLHVLLLSSYIDNWKRYLRQLSEDFLDSANIALTIDPKDSADYRVSFETLQSLRNVHDKLFLVSGYLKTSIGIVKRLEIENRNCENIGSTKAGISHIASQLNSSSDILQGNLNSADILQQRIQSILNMLGDILNLKNHFATVEMNEHMLGLTRESVDDSTTVRVVGVVSLIYLPATFIATLLGMGFFTFQVSTSKMEIAKNFWIFLALSIPLTILTVGCWVVLSIRKKSQRTAQKLQARDKRGSNEVLSVMTKATPARRSTQV